MTTRLRALLLGVALLSGLAACSEDEATTDDSTPTSSADQGGTTDASTSTSSSEERERPDRPEGEGSGQEGEEGEGAEGRLVVAIVVSDGAVEGGAQQLQVPLNTPVVIKVTTDVADEVHLHGYDVLVEAQPGDEAKLRFDATVPGVFEVELEGAGLLLAQIEVS